MKSVILIIIVFVSSISVAQNKPATFTNGLSKAFQEAIKGSDQDLNISKSSVRIEQNERLASWPTKSNKPIVIQGTGTVDPITINETEKIVSKESQIDPVDSLKNELSNLN